MEKPLPVPTHISQPFWDALREKKVRIQYSPSTDQWIFYPRVLAPRTLANDLEWREISGNGTVYTYSVAYRPTAPPWMNSLPQLLAVVEFDEGPRITTELMNIEPDAIKVGMRVKPVFFDVPDTETTLLKFEPAG